VRLLSGVKNQRADKIKVSKTVEISGDVGGTTKIFGNLKRA